MKQNKNISVPKIGMNRDTHTSLLKQTEYSLAVNANTENETGERLNITNEPSNYLSVVFSEGFKVIGFKYNIQTNRTYFWLANPNTNKSSVGYIENIEITQENVDAYNQCTDCSGYNELGIPLEEVEQLPFNNYITLFDDIECNEDEIGFDINYPIKNIEIKNEKGEVTAYWDDYKNPSRYAVLSDVSYLYRVEGSCDIEPIESENCIFVDKLLHFPNHKVMNIQAESIQTGGNLKLGTYEFWGVYCDIKGNNIVNYSTPTQPISIFDENNNFLAQTELDSFTNYAIRLTVNNLDTTFSHYKIVCVERTNVANTQSAFVAGIFPTTDNTVLYSSSGSSNDDEFLYNGNASIKRRVDINELYQVRPTYETAKGTTSSGNILWKWGLKEKETLNLQPVVNIFGSLLKWQSSVAKESLFKDPVACSKYKGYMRNEVNPFSIRFYDLDGNHSPVFPFIARPSINDEKNLIEDTNYDSINANTPQCIDGGRTQRWQILNTAFENKRIGDELWTCNSNLETITTDPTPIQKSCVVEDVFIIEDGSTTINNPIDFTDLQTYIEENPTIDVVGITEYLEDPYSESHCTPDFGENCDDPILISDYNKLERIETGVEEFILGEKYRIYSVQNGDDFYNVGFINEGQDFIATNTIPTQWTTTQVFLQKEVLNYTKKDVEDYQKSVPPGFCNTYKINTSDPQNYLRDTSFENNYMQCTGVGLNREPVYLREFDTIQKENCSYAVSIINNNPTATAGQSYFNNYYGSFVLADLQLPKDVYVTDTNFTNSLHKGALWFKFNKEGRDSLIFEITKNTTCSKPDGITEVSDGMLRYNIYTSCTEVSPIIGNTFNSAEGWIEELDLSAYPDVDIFYVAIDAPIIVEDVLVDCLTPGVTNTVYKVAPPCGCYTPYVRDVEYVSVTASWSNIYINKYEKYQANCTFQLPKVNDCEPVPFAQGEFAYWESTETYPDNKELYDSSNIVLYPSDLDYLGFEEGMRLLNFYYDDFVDDKIILRDVDFTCQPIRHFKMPDNTVSPFMSTDTSAPFSESLIFPLGVTIDSNVVRTMLIVALNNGLITQKQLNNIAGYEILRGDNTIHKSILANGLGYDIYKYSKEGKDYHYANYPFNDLRDDILHYTDNTRSRFVPHPFNGDGNNKFTIISPDLFLNAPTLPTEVVLSGYQKGASRGQFTEVKEHPKWTILGRKGRDLASLLGGLEAALELAIGLAQTAEVFRVDGGLVWSFNAPGIGLAILQASSQITSTPLKYGQYRYQWIKTFRDLGSQYNFAHYHIAEGFHNSFLPNLDESEYIRGLSLAKYMKDGEYQYIDENNGNPLRVNNYLREHSVLISSGDYNFNYDDNFKGFDTSRTIASDNSCSPNQEYESQVGSPYFTLKNYIADQFGTIDSVKWLPTNYSFNINDNNTGCITIFGGTVSISRFTWKKKLPLFKATAMGLPNKLAVEYSPYKNIAEPRFYCDYETDGTYTVNAIGSLDLPDIDSNYNFDCQNRGFYVKPNSKFYLYYYGITNFLVESEINCNFRYGKREPKNQFYPQVGDLTEWTQEVNVPIKEPNTFYYNNVYSLPVSNIPYRFLDSTYSKELWTRRANQENAVIYSEPDNSQNEIFDSWRVFKPLNWNEFDKKYGKLIGLKDLESSQLLVRFENGMLLLNSIDSLADRITPQNKALGTAGVFTTRPLEFKRTDLGFAGTQNTDMVSTPYGHIWGDALRGKVFMLNQSGKGLEVISEMLGNQPTNMKNWFKENLPFKILKYFPNADIDNKFKGLGLNIWYDSKFDRVFITKRDYIPKQECIEYTDNDFYFSCVDTDCSDDNLVTNGDFSSGLEGWSTEYEGDITIIDGKAWFNNSDDVASNLSQDILEIGKTYKINFDMYINPECNLQKYVRVSAGTTYSDYYVQGEDVNIELLLTCTENTTFNIETRYQCLYGEEVNTISIDNICVREQYTKQKIDVDNENYFEDVSWTISFKAGEGWNSYFTFYPDYTISKVDHFEVGYNFGQDEETLWQHPMNNSSFQVFQGRLNPFMVEYPIINENTNKLLNSLSLNVESKRWQTVYQENNIWQNSLDYSQHPEIGFNKAYIWNNTNNSGLLELVEQRTLSQAKDYPKTKLNSQEILFTALEGKHTFNYFYNRIINERNNIPMFINDKNRILKTINPQAVAFKGKPVLEKLKGETFNVTLINDKESRFNILLKNSVNNETLYE